MRLRIPNVAIGRELGTRHACLCLPLVQGNIPNKFQEER